MKSPYRWFLGWDAAEMRAWNVAQSSARRLSKSELDIERIERTHLEARGLYTRPTKDLGDGHLWDEISGAPMSTGHAIGRFFVPYLCGYEGWALFTDGDVLVRDDLTKLFALADPQYAIQVVQHAPLQEVGFKKDGHIQTTYGRKNWSSVVLWHAGHPANQALTIDVLNAWPGRDLHAFKWLADDLIGALPARWNHLVGVQPPYPDVAIAHFTQGAPDLPGYEYGPFADEWYDAAFLAGYRLVRPPKVEDVA